MVQMSHFIDEETEVRKCKVLPKAIQKVVHLGKT